MLSHVVEVQGTHIAAFIEVADKTTESMEAGAAECQLMLADLVADGVSDGLRKKYSSKPIKDYLKGWKFMFKNIRPAAETFMAEIGACQDEEDEDVL